MSEHTRVFTLEGSSITDGNTETLTESDDSSWVIEKVQVTEEGQAALNGATATVSVSGTSFTDQTVALGSLQAEYEDLPHMGIVWPSNSQFEFDYTNNSGSSATVNVVLWVKPASDSQASAFPDRVEE